MGEVLNLFLGGHKKAIRLTNPIVILYISKYFFDQGYILGRKKNSSISWKLNFFSICFIHKTIFDVSFPMKNLNFVLDITWESFLKAPQEPDRCFLIQFDQNWSQIFSFFPRTNQSLYERKLLKKNCNVKTRFCWKQKDRFLSEILLDCEKCFEPEDCSTASKKNSLWLIIKAKHICTFQGLFGSELRQFLPYSKNLIAIDLFAESQFFPTFKTAIDCKILWDHLSHKHTQTKR